MSEFFQRDESQGLPYGDKGYEPGVREYAQALVDAQRFRDWLAFVFFDGVKVATTDDALRAAVQGRWGDMMTAASLADGHRDASEAMLECCKQLREALAALMWECGANETTEAATAAWEGYCNNRGLTGMGGRADAAIAKAEGR